MQSNHTVSVAEARDLLDIVDAILSERGPEEVVSVKIVEHLKGATLGLMQERLVAPNQGEVSGGGK